MLVGNFQRFTELQILDCLSTEVGKTNREIIREMNLSLGSEGMLRELMYLFVSHGYVRQRVRPTTLEERKKVNGYKFTESLITKIGIQKRKELQQKSPQRRVPCG